MTPQEKGRELVDTLFDGYMVSRDGRIFSKKTNRYLGQSLIVNGYRSITLRVNGKSLTKSIHRLVAIAFCENPHNKKYVNHKDGNKLNNMAENLEWVTHRENMLHAIKYGLYTPPKNNRHELSQPIIQIDLEGNFVAEYLSAKEAARVTGIGNRWMAACARGGYFRWQGGVQKWKTIHSFGGFVWKWKTNRESKLLGRIRKQVKNEIQKL